MTNLVVVALALQALFHMAVIAGVATFMAKYLQNQFSISASKANLFVGKSFGSMGNSKSLLFFFSFFFEDALTHFC